MAMHILDVKNLLCPMPVIKVQEQIEKSSVGDIIEVFVTDPGAKEDIPCWCRINGHNIKKIVENEDGINITILVN